MIVLIAMIVCLLLFALGVPGVVLGVAGLIPLIIVAIHAYYAGLKKYWSYKQAEQYFDIAKMKRYTLLKEILSTIGEWSNYEKEVMSDSTATSVNTSWLMQRFPNIATVNVMIPQYINELRKVENDINVAIRHRVDSASRWWVLRDNIFTGFFLPRYSDVPRDLHGEVYDPKLPTTEYGRW